MHFSGPSEINYNLQSLSITLYDEFAQKASVRFSMGGGQSILTENKKTLKRATKGIDPFCNDSVGNDDERVGSWYRSIACPTICRLLNMDKERRRENYL